MATTYAQSIITTGINFGQDTLDYYDEGTFTPVLAFGGASAGITYSTQTGHYTRTGSVVTCQINIILTSKGTSTGAAGMGGLPFAPATGTAPISMLAAQNLTYTGSAYLGFAGPGFTTTTFLSQISGGAISILNNTAFVDTSTIRLIVTYLV